MADSVRQQIVEALKALLQTIRTINGYETELGANVSEWRTTEWQESELPGCDIRDPSEATEVKGQYHYNTLDIEIEAKIKGSTVTTEVRNVIAEITKALGTVTRTSTLGLLVTQISPVDNESLDMEQKDRKFSSTLMRFNILYRIKAFKPYSVA